MYMKINKQKGSATIILLIFIILILSGVIIYLLLKDKNQIEEKDVMDEVGQIQIIDNSTSTVSKATTSSDKIVNKTTIEKATGIIKSFAYTKSLKRYLDIDYVVFEDCKVTMDCPNGFGSMINENPKIRTIEISPDVKVYIDPDLNGLNKLINIDDFINIFSGVNDYRKYNPWDITITNGAITKIVEHFRP
jgi:hypothetical protein